MAATPGTSNHGWGLAADLAEERDADPQVESVSTSFVAWLVKNAAIYGFAAEAQSEPWHWVYTEGDKIPAAVTGETTTEPAPARKTIRRGDKGPEVRLCQNLLVENGIKVRGGSDGIFGKHTEAAVRAFQTARGLKADGVVGSKTWLELEK
jgi:murein L,D-transpeptidase YcbB/YkuD